MTASPRQGPERPPGPRCTGIVDPGSRVARKTEHEHVNHRTPQVTVESLGTRSIRQRVQPGVARLPSRLTVDQRGLFLKQVD